MGQLTGWALAVKIGTVNAPVFAVPLMITTLRRVKCAAHAKVIIIFTD